MPGLVCVKVSTFLDAWVRETYFGQLLRKEPRALRIYDAFPIFDDEGVSRVLYCLVIEHAPHGDLSDYLARTGKGWSEAGARREIGAVLKVLGKLHRGQTLHRDLTPMNVFVFDRKRLKLGDFGIARHQSDGRGVTARTMNKMTAPVEIVAGSVPKWQARDDVYQMGQLLGMLVKGDARGRIKTSEIRRLPCSGHLKEILHRCIGERRKRYESADELIAALAQKPVSPANGTPDITRRRAPRLYRNAQQTATRGRCGGAQGGARPCTELPRRRPRSWCAANPTRARRPGREGGTQADGDQAPPREGARDQAVERPPVLAPCREHLRTSNLPAEVRA